jgi:hypothetical protein
LSSGGGVASVTREREQIAEPSAAELRAEPALLRWAADTIVQGILVLVTIGLFVVLLALDDGERVLAWAVAGAMAVVGSAATVLMLQTLEIVPSLRRRSR